MDSAVIAFVTNGAWIEGNSTDGFRKVITNEFDKIYVLNLRGNQRTGGEKSRREGEKIFGSGSRTPISINFLIKNNTKKKTQAEIYYHDIGDYLSREDKLKAIKKFDSIKSIKWKRINLNNQGDWINQRSSLYQKFIPIKPNKKFDKNEHSFFIAQTNGLGTGRDFWLYNYNKKLCIKTNSCLRINLSFEIDEKFYFFINVVLLINNEGETIKEDFIETFSEIFLYDDEEGYGGFVEHYFCDRKNGGFDLRDGISHLEDYMNLSEDLDEEIFFDKVNKLRSEIR